MKPFELAYLCLEPFLPPLHGQIRRKLKKIARSHTSPDVLDVGGRKSHYTIGVDGRITITDLPRTTPQQAALNLGLTDTMMTQTRARRSNVNRMLIDDMTQSRLADQSFDCVVAVEVLEHVEGDALFVAEVHRVLRPAGVFLLSTPNGDWVPVTNPDHKRHYRREELRTLLLKSFAVADVEYAIQGGWMRRLGLRPWSRARPVQTAVSMLCNVGNRIQSARPGLKHQFRGTHHLIAMATRDPIVALAARDDSDKVA